MAFPTLTRRPRTVKKTPVDNTLRQSTEGGYDIRRPKYTRKKYQFEVTYDLLPTVDKSDIKSHYDTVGTHTSFTWTDIEGSSYTVYYDSPVEFSNFVTGWYSFEPIKLIEV